jgi:hypothetical protein
MESPWSKETFYINRITDNTVNPEMLMGRWDALYYNLSADQGHADGQMGSAICVEKIFRASANLAEATNFMKPEAEPGDGDGHFDSKAGARQLFGVAIDFDEAARYSKLPADQGIPSSQINDGGRLLNGLDVSVNHKEAARSLSWRYCLTLLAACGLALSAFTTNFRRFVASRRAHISGRM